jgi:hypothetical protein
VGSGRRGEQEEERKRRRREEEGKKTRLRGGEAEEDVSKNSAVSRGGSAKSKRGNGAGSGGIRLVSHLGRRRT